MVFAADPIKAKYGIRRPGRKYFFRSLNPNSHQNSHLSKTKKAAPLVASTTY
jgi:hypothetical protein